MRYDRLTTGLAVVLGTLTVVLTVVALLSNLAVLFLALTFGIATYLVWYHASGRMASRLYERVERQARVDGGRRRRGTERGRAARGGGSAGARRRAGAGPRDDWTPPRDGATAREAAFGGRARSGRGRGARGRRARAGAGGQRQRRRAPTANDGPSPAEAYRTLGLDPGADEATVKSAYRQRVKEVHPDADGGDEDEFMAVKEAYETLTD